MNFLCGGHTVHGPHTCNFDWLQYFDVVITGRSFSFLVSLIYCFDQNDMIKISDNDYVLFYEFVDEFCSWNTLIFSFVCLNSELVTLCEVRNLVSSMKRVVPVYLRWNLSLECFLILTMEHLCLRFDLT